MHAEMPWSAVPIRRARAAVLRCVLCVAAVSGAVRAGAGAAVLVDGAARPVLRSVTPVPDAVREALRLDPFYRKHTVVDGFSIVSSEKVSDFALREAAWILEHMLAGRPDILRVMAAKHVRVTVMAATEYTTDVPEHRRLTPRVFWDRRARGLGGSPVSCGEENLLCFPGDPYAEENLLIHEFAHALHHIGMREIDPTFDRRLRAAYDAALADGLWKGTYAATNHSEYWAEGVQSWFDNNRANDALHNHVNTREKLKAYDPALAALLAEVFGDNPWRYRKPMEREPEGRAHLEGFDHASAPRFRWRKEVVPDAPRVLIQTELGDVEVELDAARAPITVKSFLRHVHEGLYADGAFFRTLTGDNPPDGGVKIQAVQVRAHEGKRAQFGEPIVLERTRDTGIAHRDGTLTMARAGKGAATDSFLICIGDQPELDVGGRHGADGQGPTAFGRVVKGMDVLRRIHAAPADGQMPAPPVRIQRAIRLN